MRSTLAIAVSLATASLLASSACAPRTAGLEARKEADARFQRTTSLVSFDQAKQAFESGELEKARKEVEKALARSNREAKYWSRSAASSSSRSAWSARWRRSPRPSSAIPRWPSRTTTAASCTSAGARTTRRSPTT